MEFLEEEVIAKRVIVKTRVAARKRQTKTINKALEQGPLGTNKQDSEINNYKSKDFK